MKVKHTPKKVSETTNLVSEQQVKRPAARYHKSYYMRYLLISMVAGLVATSLLHYTYDLRNIASHVKSYAKSKLDISPVDTPSPVLPVARRIIAVGDLHGDMENTLKTFRMAGIVNEKVEWIAGDSVFVQTGDVVDRGPDTIELYKMMIRLAKEAREAGGKVFLKITQVLSVLGNHEVMNLMLDWRFVTPEDIDSFGGQEAREEAWDKNGWLGSYIRKLPICAWVNGTVFFHGGANPKWAALGVDGLNKLTHDGLAKLTSEEMWHYKIFGNDGPLWYRGYATSQEKSICDILDEALVGLNATRMVIGHTPQMSGQILSRCSNRVHVIGTFSSDC